MRLNPSSEAVRPWPSQGFAENAANFVVRRQLVLTGKDFDAAGFDPLDLPISSVTNDAVHSDAPFQRVTDLFYRDAISEPTLHALVVEVGVDAELPAILSMNVDGV